jgi:hypothetical protein
MLRESSMTKKGLPDDNNIDQWLCVLASSSGASESPESDDPDWLRLVQVAVCPPYILVCPRVLTDSVDELKLRLIVVSQIILTYTIAKKAMDTCKLPGSVVGIDA